jgi:nicotinamide-nucleotide amidase
MNDDINKIAEAVIELAKAKNKTIGTAESCTGGWIGQALTSIPGSSSVFMGGLTTYSNDVKINVLGIPSDIVNFYGAVSEPTASAMAMQARDLLRVDIAVSVTGIAGPGGGCDEKPVGLVYFGLATGDRPTTFMKKFGDIGREHVRAQSVIFALELIRNALTD